ncbi:DWNN domain-containing protein [Entamoeba marina]
MSRVNTIQYHFAVSKNSIKTIKFIGRTITASEVIASIIKQSNSYSGNELHIFDLQTNQEYQGRDLITGNTHLRVKRRPCDVHSQKPNQKPKPNKINLEPTPEKQKVQASVENSKEEEQQAYLTCSCGNILSGAVFVFCCGETICDKCFEKGVCPVCKERVDKDNTRPRDDIRQKVIEYLKEKEITTN